MRLINERARIPEIVWRDCQKRSGNIKAITSIIIHLFRTESKSSLWKIKE